MRANRIINISFFVLLLMFQSCSDNSVNQPAPAENLISNWSFEKNGQPIIEGWVLNPNGKYSFSNTAPEGGGMYSIQLDCNWGIPNEIRTSVPAYWGNTKYEFSLLSRKEDFGGYFSINIKRSDSLITLNKINIDSDSWRIYSVFDSIQTKKNDSLVIILAGGFSQVLTGKTYFDLVRLEKLD